MSLRSDYEAAKSSYHRAGNALRLTQKNRPERKAIYEKAKHLYQQLGRKLAKKGR
jgi:hypothetical protein